MGGEDRRYVPVRDPTQGVDEEQHAHFTALLGMAFTDGRTSNDDAAAATLQHRQGVASDMAHKGDCDRRGVRALGVHWTVVDPLEDSASAKLVRLGTTRNRGTVGLCANGQGTSGASCAAETCTT